MLSHTARALRLAANHGPQVAAAARAAAAVTSVTLLGAQRGVHMRREDSVGDGLMGAGGIDWSGAELLLSLAAQVQREQASALAAPVTHPCPEASLRCSTAAVAHRLSKKVATSFGKPVALSAFVESMEPSVEAGMQPEWDRLSELGVANTTQDSSAAPSSKDGSLRLRLKHDLVAGLE